jgi:hypothetical protein
MHHGKQNNMTAAKNLYLDVSLMMMTNEPLKFYVEIDQG